ncbi:MAG: hypothetical protein JWL81_3474 [Verrucomicrobiales bacterium]|nr:hypothetical protein [Verrucomicrobiales bacterium]
MKNLIKTTAKKGFSLVELLVVIAVIGVIAAIAIPAMSGVFENSTTAKNKRNAQSIASLYSSLRAAGATVTSPSATNIATALTTDNGVSGVPGTAFASTRFYAPMSSTEAASAAAALTYDSTTDSLAVIQ